MQKKLTGVILTVLISLGIFTPRPAQASYASVINEMIHQLLVVVDPVLPYWLWKSVRAGNKDSDFAELGLTKGVVQAWEDGARQDITTDDFTFEWWYFDGRFDDGSAFVVTCHSRIALDQTRPFMTINITRSDGSNIFRDIYGSRTTSSFSTTECDFNIDNNYISSDNGTTYYIDAAIEDIQLNLILKRTVPSFRQDTGYFFMDNDEKYLAWFAMVPKGTLNGTITYDGTDHPVTGIGYHDHNWGNVNPQEVTNGWWWMRGFTDKYTIIAYEFRFKNAYGAKKLPIYGIMNSAKVMAVYDSSQKVSFDGYDFAFPPDPAYSTRKSDRIPYEIDIQSGTWWNCWYGKNCIQMQFVSEDMIDSIDIVGRADYELSATEKALMELLSYDPWYTRFTGTVDLVVKNFNGWSYSGSGDAIIEYMDFE